MSGLTSCAHAAASYTSFRFVAACLRVITIPTWQTKPVARRQVGPGGGGEEGKKGHDRVPFQEHYTYYVYTRQKQANLATLFLLACLHASSYTMPACLFRHAGGATEFQVWSASLSQPLRSDVSNNHTPTLAFL